jgi:SAM-dependent methyltransferase
VSKVRSAERLEKPSGGAALGADYFSNHRMKLRFPWSLYHSPIVESAASVLQRSAAREVLNIGAGPFFELSRLDAPGRRFTICDIDSRAMDVARSRHGERIARADVVPPGAPLPYDDASFDVVLSMDVIEHVDPPLPWLREAWRVLKPRGTLFLTTPNYGSRSLRLLESTALEVLARAQGFSRKDIHPTKFDEARLVDALDSIGAARARVNTIAFGWVLTATVEKS